MKPLSKTALSFQESFFTIFSDLAKKHQAINLAQGLPDFDGPQFANDYAIKAINDGINQSSHANGDFILRKALSDFAREKYQLIYDPEDEVTITSGATEGVFSSVKALINPGDEVIVFEPMFDIYLPAIKMAGGIPKIVTLHAPNFEFDEEELKKAITPKCKLIILNAPHNPTGKIFTLQELKTLEKYILQNDLYLLTDEVYEFLTFNEQKHLPPATLKDLRERTITCSSASKTFGKTGWRIGWTFASKELTSAIRKIHQNLVFSATHPLQIAIAKSLGHMKDYVPSFQQFYQEKRDYLAKGLQEKNLKVLTPQSTYFLLVEIPKNEQNAHSYAMRLIEEKKVASLPLNLFYENSHEGERYLRFCFAKEDHVLQKAIQNLG